AGERARPQKPDRRARAAQVVREPPPGLPPHLFRVQRGHEQVTATSAPEAEITSYFRLTAACRQVSPFQRPGTPGMLRPWLPRTCPGRIRGAWRPGAGSSSTWSFPVRRCSLLKPPSERAASRQASDQKEGRAPLSIDARPPSRSETNE